MTDFDQAARYAARNLDPAAFLRWLLGELLWAAWRWVGWLDSQSVPFPGEPDRRMDTVAEFARRAGDAPPLAVVVEFMSKARRATLARVAEYTVRLHRELPAQRDPLVRYDVIGVVMNLTGKTTRGSRHMRPADVGGLGLSADLGVVNVSALEAAEVLAGVACGAVPRCVLPWAPLMRGGGEATVQAEWVRLALAETDATRRADYGGLAVVFANLAGSGGVWRQTVEGLNVERSVFIQEWEARGELRATRATLLRILKVRLRQEVPADLVQAVQAQGDRATLDRWLDLALTVASFEEARAAFGLGNGA
jgi:hypothetical protein